MGSNTTTTITRDPAGRVSPERIRQMLVDGELTLSDVVDAVIETNGIVGVGLITLADNVKAYIMAKVSSS